MTSLRFFPVPLCLCLLSVPVAPAQAAPGTIVVFGDSTTADDPAHPVYGRLLEAKLNELAPGTVRVINAGVRGNTTAMAAKRFTTDVLAAGPDLVVIQFGINDATIDVWQKPPATAPRTSLADYRANLARFVTEARAHGAQVVLMTPNPLEWTPRLIELYGHPPYDPRDPASLNFNLDHYADAMRELATAEHVPLVDVRAAHLAARRAGEAPLLSDGMHPNARGHELVARMLAETIAQNHLLDAR